MNPQHKGIPGPILVRLPKRIETLFALDSLLEKSGRWSEALRYLDEILDIDDANLTAMYRKREVLEKQTRWDDVVSLQKSILKHEHSEKDKKREHDNLIGYEYEYGSHSLESSQLEKAKKAFRNIIRTEKDFVPAILGLAEVLLQEGESEEAINVLENAFASTESKILLARLEDLLISISEPSRLIRIYRSGISRNPNDPVGLRMDEAMHPLAILAVGLYGQLLPSQNGAPLRLVVPWKYGFKSIKSIIGIRFTAQRPRTSWEKSAPREFGFYANVNPDVDHPRWSQARERRLGAGSFWDRQPTLPFNGYARDVASLYSGMDLVKDF